jgi:hypothetical protein
VNAQPEFKLLEMDEVVESLQHYTDSDGGRMEPHQILKIPSLTTPEDIQELEEQLRVVLPDEFKKLILEYRFDGFDLEWISFAYSPDTRYLDTVLSYTLSDDEIIPDRLVGRMIWVASTDVIHFMMDCEDGRIYGYDFDFPDDIGLVAGSFSLFVRGVCTLSISEGDTKEYNEKLHKFIKQAVGTTWDRFW